MAQPLPIAACKLDAAGMREQGDRYRRLATAVARIDRRGRELVVEFGEGVDVRLLEETLGIERACCSFFGLDYDASERRLVASVAHAEHEPALGVLADALSA
ncbi:MAG: hypothetical protein QOG63_1216 [Thermoleophilaceae bacterium]|jgi:hypothetical protein|nr:hypothetical protein [Thermoleophilaceae bacterium]